jgi:hypothetical protein
MVGDFQLRQREQQEYFEKTHWRHRKQDWRSIWDVVMVFKLFRWAKLGFIVHAVDFNAQLLMNCANESPDIQ